MFYCMFYFTYDRSFTVGPSAYARPADVEWILTLYEFET